jgi:hypothetical protein
MNLTDDQRVLLEDKFVLWDRASREGAMDLRDYNGRAAEALKIALSLASSAEAAEARAQAATQALAEATEVLEPPEALVDAFCAAYTDAGPQSTGELTLRVKKARVRIALSEALTHFRRAASLHAKLTEGTQT